MTTSLLPYGLLVWAGITLLLSGDSYSARKFVRRLEPYGFGRPAAAVPSPWWSTVALARGRKLVALISTGRGALTARLRGARVDLSEQQYRSYVAIAVAGCFVSATGITALIRPPAPVAGLFITGTPSLAWLLAEHWLRARAAYFQRRIQLELPVVTEQVAMLVDAGHSISSALQHIADRGRGVCRDDIVDVLLRVNQGAGETEALRSWADDVRIPELTQLVSVLSLRQHTGELGRLLSQLATNLRRESHRRNILIMERREQQVWIPVTVATLVPGTILLAIPFMSALRIFTDA